MVMTNWLDDKQILCLKHVNLFCKYSFDLPNDLDFLLNVEEHTEPRLLKERNRLAQS